MAVDGLRLRLISTSIVKRTAKIARKKPSSSFAKLSRDSHSRGKTIAMAIQRGKARQERGDHVERKLPAVRNAPRRQQKFVVVTMRRDGDGDGGEVKPGLRAAKKTRRGARKKKTSNQRAAARRAED